jgi:hypothetical protein
MATARTTAPRALTLLSPRTTDYKNSRRKIANTFETVSTTLLHAGGILVLGVRQRCENESWFTEAEIRQVLSVTGIAEDGLRAWKQRPKGDTRNPLAGWDGTKAPGLSVPTYSDEPSCANAFFRISSIASSITSAFDFPDGKSFPTRGTMEKREIQHHDERRRVLLDLDGLLRFTVLCCS